jgi:gluconate:H+ symporter, GntP family
MDPFLILLIGVSVVVAAIVVLRLHAFLALVLAALVVGGLTSPTQIETYASTRSLPGAEVKKLTSQSSAERVARAFGNTCGSIGIMIALAAVVGKALLDSGAADRVVRAAFWAVGAKRAPFALSATGFLLGIAVFFETVFYLLIPIGKSLATRTGKNYALYVMMIAGGASLAHSLVPPTPGPLLVAGELKIEIGTMILVGLALGGVATACAWSYVFWVNRRWPVPLRESGGVSLEELRDMADRDVRTLPPLWLSLAPILLPVVLIGGDSVLSQTWGKLSPGALALWQLWLCRGFKMLGNANIALSVSAAIALLTLARQKKGDRAAVTAAVESSLTSGAVIILVTAAGGAFGGVLQQTGIGERIQSAFPLTSIGLLVLLLAFVVTALVKTAQGSATVAMITAVGMFAGVAAPEQLGFHPVYLAAAIGFGSKPFSWMNDSGFWLIGKMSGLSPAETLRCFSAVIGVEAVVGLVITMIAARMLPLV